MEKEENEYFYAYRRLPTKDLVEELRRREGVEASTLAPNVEATVKASGPAIVLVIID